MAVDFILANRRVTLGNPRFLDCMAMGCVVQETATGCYGADRGRGCAAAGACQQNKNKPKTKVLHCLPETEPAAHRLAAGLLAANQTSLGGKLRSDCDAFDKAC